MSRLLLAAIAAALATAHAAGTAAAAIVCERGFQVVNGQPVSPPYCQDNYLAVVAREYGVKVSEAEIRTNHHTKKQVCHMLGGDIRVQQACASAGEPRGARGH